MIKATTCFPRAVEWIFAPFVITRMPRTGQCLYLTFDDGPHSQITPKVLDILNRFQVKATFFCLGKNIRAYPEVFQEIKNNGHNIGNHSFSHKNGWKTANKECFKDIEACRELIPTNLFRPPYGRMRVSQVRVLSRQYQIILWTLLSGDYNRSLSSEEILRTLLRRTRSGDIIVFHDNEKAFPCLIEVLPSYLEAMLEKGFTFDVIQSKL
ncbi:MAG TPA: polysaccharide deacetylase family protein [Bacteroidales bacterium]|nr:polysaccharide deacetylase family protein [Bacteroidales bacterium]